MVGHLQWGQAIQLAYPYDNVKLVLYTIRGHTTPTFILQDASTFGIHSGALRKDGNEEMVHRPFDDRSFNLFRGLGS